MAPDRIYSGQVYRCIGEKPYIRQRTREETTLQQWQSHCAECGEAFSFWVPAEAKKFSPNRRCQKHKRPGVKVAKRSAA